MKSSGQFKIKSNQLGMIFVLFPVVILLFLWIPLSDVQGQFSFPCTCQDGSGQDGTLQNNRCVSDVTGKICDGQPQPCTCQDGSQGTEKDGQCISDQTGQVCDGQPQPCTCQDGSQGTEKDGQCISDQTGQICDGAAAIPLPPSNPNPIDVLLLVDVSGSMEGFALDQNMNKLKAAKQALSHVVQNMTNTVRFQIWTFSGTITQLPIPTKADGKMERGKFEPIARESRQALLNIIRNIKISEDANVTNLYLALKQAMQYYYSPAYNPPPSAPPTKVIVVLSDGKDDKFSPVKLGDILIAKARFPDIEIKTIGFGISNQSPFHKELCTLATQNQCALAQDAKQLQSILKSFTNF